MSLHITNILCTGPIYQYATEPTCTIILCDIFSDLFDIVIRPEKNKNTLRLCVKKHNRTDAFHPTNTWS